LIASEQQRDGKIPDIPIKGIERAIGPQQFQVLRGVGGQLWQIDPNSLSLEDDEY
jgi:hypothetical protein